MHGTIRVGKSSLHTLRMAPVGDSEARSSLTCTIPDGFKRQLREFASVITLESFVTKPCWSKRNNSCRDGLAASRGKRVSTTDGYSASLKCGLLYYQRTVVHRAGLHRHCTGSHCIAWSWCYGRQRWKVSSSRKKKPHGLESRWSGIGVCLHCQRESCRCTF